SHGVSRHLTVSHAISQCLTASHSVSRYLTASHSVSRHLTASHGISQRLTASHGISRRLMASHSVSRRLTVSHGVSRYLKAPDGIPRHLTTSHVRCQKFSYHTESLYQGLKLVEEQAKGETAWDQTHMWVCSCASEAAPGPVPARCEPLQISAALGCHPGARTAWASSGTFSPSAVNNTNVPESLQLISHRQKVLAPQKVWRLPLTVRRGVLNPGRLRNTLVGMGSGTQSAAEQRDRDWNAIC
ncbi:hypothetical protein P4O66_021777, partial [Electrophorus voltai]